MVSGKARSQGRPSFLRPTLGCGTESLQDTNRSAICLPSTSVTYAQHVTFEEPLALQEGGSLRRQRVERFDANISLR